MSRKIMIVEGEDETSFFRTFCNKKQLPEFEYISVGGKSKIKSRLALLINDPDSDEIETIIVVQDADASHANTLQSLKATFRNAGLPVPDDHLTFANDTEKGLKVGCYVMPGDGSEGMLEDLLLQSVSDSPVKEEAENYIGKLLEIADTGAIEAPKNLPKAKLHAYLSGLKKHQKNIGLATAASCFNLDSAALEPLRAFLASA